MLCYFKKSKKDCAVYGRLLSLIQCVKSGLRSFPLGITHWTMLHSWVDQLKLIAIKTLIKNNQSYTTAGIVDKLKIFKSSVEKHLHQLGYVNRFDVWVPHKLSKKKIFLTIFPHMILYLGITKPFHFKNSYGRWKVGTVQ